MPNFISRRSMALAVSGLLVLASTACNRSRAVGKPAGSPPVPVQTAVAEQRDMPRIVEAVGSIQARRTVSVKSQVDGMIAQIHFHEGDEVKAGDPLVTLDRRPFENSLRIARADLENARAEAKKADADVERYRRLDQQDVISKEQFTQLETKHATSHAILQAKEAAVANSELQLSYAQIRAPISGRTGQILLHEGALVKANDAGQSIVTLNELAPITAAFAVPESTLAGIRTAIAAGNAAVTVLDRSTGMTRKDGRLTFIDNTVDPTTGTITLKAEFANEDHALWPGQFVQAKLAVGFDPNVVVVPTSAVQLGQGTTQVFVVKPEGTVELRPVRVMRTSDDFTLLAQGVRGGEEVVTDGQLRLVNGSRVERRSISGAPAGDRTAQATP